VGPAPNNPEIIPPEAPEDPRSDAAAAAATAEFPNPGWAEGK